MKMCQVLDRRMKSERGMDAGRGAEAAAGASGGAAAMKQTVREVIVVEGRYDKNALSQVVDATIVTLGGFAVFNDREKLAFLRRLAEQRGLIVLTDSDGAGFVIRNYLKGALPRDRVKQAYIPDIRGKERRKRAPGKEGKLGVEGMKPARCCWRRSAGPGPPSWMKKTEHSAEKSPSPRRTCSLWDSPAAPAAPPGGRRCCGSWTCRNT